MSDVEQKELTEEEYREEVFSEDYDETTDLNAGNAVQDDVDYADDTAMQAANMAQIELQQQKDEEQTETVVDDKPQEPTTQEMFANINEKLGAIDNLTFRLKQAEGRIGSVQNAVQNNKQQPQPTEKVPTKEELIAATKSEEEWNELKEEYPDLIENLETRFASKDAPPAFDLDDIRNNIATDIDSRVVASEANVGKLVERRMVDIMRPGWKDDIFENVNGQSQAKAEYVAWYNAAPLEMQKNARSDNAEEAIRAYDDFVNSQKATLQETPEQIQERRNKRLSASQTTTGSSVPLKTKSVDDMTDAEYRVWLSQQPD